MDSYKLDVNLGGQRCHSATLISNLLIIQPVSLQRIAGLHHHWSHSEILSHLYYSLNVIRTVEVWPTSPYALGLFCWGRTLVGIQLFIRVTLMRCAAKNSSSSETSVRLAFFHPLQPLHLLFTGLRWWKSICKVLFFPTCFLRLKSHFFWKMAKVHICQ